ncbi:MAG TPA: hypothetical protein VK427_14935 [Kofleriaceae bacterium]|nr:hypothetical protein [Kofleriaceae bacterium]
MTKTWKTVRNTLAAIAFAGSMGFGVTQAVATTESPDTAYTCGQWACRIECAPFGGHLVPGGPGKPLRCACCG